MLNLNVNKIGPEGAVHIADLVKESKSIRMLLLHGNPIEDLGVHSILDAIISTKDTSITNLDLGDCHMGDAGATDVARLLLNNTTITDLTISGNTIGLSGWRIISSALEQNITLRSLSLDFSNIRDDEAVILAEGIKENKGLRSLDLEGNKIGDEGGRSLLDAIRVNTTLVDLTLMPMNEISKDIHDEIKTVLDGRYKTPSRASSANGSIQNSLSAKDEHGGEEIKPASKTGETPQIDNTPSNQDNTKSDNTAEGAAVKTDDAPKPPIIEDELDTEQLNGGSLQVDKENTIENREVPGKESDDPSDHVELSTEGKIDTTMYLQ